MDSRPSSVKIGRSPIEQTGTYWVTAFQIAEGQCGFVQPSLYMPVPLFLGLPGRTDGDQEALK